jgi:hypothetical protein
MARQRNDVIVSIARDLLPHYCGFQFRKGDPLLNTLNTAIATLHSEFTVIHEQYMKRFEGTNKRFTNDVDTQLINSITLTNILGPVLLLAMGLIASIFWHCFEHIFMQFISTKNATLFD